MYVQLVIFHFFYLHSFPLSFLFLRERGNLNSFEIQGEHQGIPHEDGCQQILRGGLIYFKPFWGGGGLFERGGLFNLETTMVSVLQNRLEYKVEKLKYKKF